MTTRMQLRVASPCSERWDAMQGDEQKRFCARCQLHVYNLSVLSMTEVEALVQRTEGRLCGRFYTRGDGTALTRDCPVGLRRARIRLAAVLTTATAFLCAVFLTVPRDGSSAPLGFLHSASYWKSQARSLPLIGNLIRKMEPQEDMGGLAEVDNPGRKATDRVTRKTLKDFGSNPQD